jgi:hypothetical protein
MSIGIGICDERHAEGEISVKFYFDIVSIGSKTG